MGELPAGTVTFLFTDIEGSTKLLHELGDGYADVLAEHRRTLRDAFAAHDGVEVDTQGDAFFIAFTRASDAVAAAADALRELARGPVRVRIGIHTGEPRRTGEGYVGMDVHRAARIAAVGHGGQVLVSQTTRDLVEADLPTELALHDLGDHRLKDLSAPQRIFQLIGDGLERDFPALKTLESRPTNLPPQPTRLIGREQELTEVGALLRQPEVRLLTVTGPGGAGKTRLVLQAAADQLDEYDDGVFFVGLAGITEPALVIPAIARTLGVKESGGLSPEEALARYVHERELLLVLDNLEHLLEAGPVIHELVLNAPGIKAISSSRSPLRVSGEREYPIPDLGADEAVMLFCERAQSNKPDFRLNGDAPAVNEICSRLDRLPLAIELAAARVKVLSPGALLERLGQRLPMLSAGARDLPDRQRTLRDTIVWSYELLDEAEQRLFARLAVFAGGFTVAAAEDVCDADIDTLGSLVDKSLVRHEEGRFRMLETIREFARERLRESPDEQLVLRRHVDFFLALAGSGDMSRDSRTSEWLRRLYDEQENLRAALQYARELGDARLELRLATEVSGFWEYRSLLREGLERLREALDRNSDAPAELRGEAMRRGALIAVKQGDFETAGRMADELGRLFAEPPANAGLANALNLKGLVAQHDGRFDEARALLERARSMREQLGETVRLVASYHNLGLLSMYQGDYTTARTEIEAGLEIARREELEWNIANSLCDLGFAELGDRRLEEARSRFAEAHSMAARIGWLENVAYGLVGFSALAVADDDLHKAARMMGQVDHLAEDISLKFEVYAERVRAQVKRDLASGLGRDELATLQAEGRSLSMADIDALVD